MYTININDENTIDCIKTINGVKKIKTISLTSFYEALASSIEKKDANNGDMNISPILPVLEHIHTIQYAMNSNETEVTIILLRGNKPIDMIYFDTLYENVAVPKLLFAIKLFNGRIANLKIAAVKSNFINKDTKIYYYPFSHVNSPTSQACLGSNNFGNEDFKIKCINNTFKIPDMFLSMPNTNDYYNNVNNSNLALRLLLNNLSNSESFPDNWLKDGKLTYDEWINKLI